MATIALPTLTNVQQLDTITMAIRRHAGSCRSCYSPIIDDAGNVGLGIPGNACAYGSALVRRYVNLEHAILADMRH